ncbi:pyrroloquinoline quinone biosynthesis protein PqqB [Streptomyces cyanogenus]|uniref:Coenzyme PQQ synthesis protein B n=1 Tax=Streptomyces cyanogenus TaxID=80860 RepID=A0ABX7TM07_STRCY|nr:MBL fold metallo-hydrolase [Streptomyces cyanogenus]QTD96511.1 Coenzyme PQQ synthesis protein B [Streptomyces cyanogenus]
MRVVLLGTAAGGGLPRWNCACAFCTAARDGTLPARTRECAAVTGNGRDWWLLNASPDLRTQLAATPALWPGPRHTPLRGVLLTDAESDHVTGLTELRGAAGLKIYAAPPVRAVLDRHAHGEWADSAAEGGFVLAGGLVVTAHPVGTAIRTGPSWTAYRIEDLASGGVLVYAPCVGAWSPVLDELCAGADCVLLDGTCFTADETGTGVRSGAGRAAPGHLPVGGPDGSLAALARHPGPRRIYTHLGDGNPLLDPVSPARARVTEHGAEILPDGTELVL